MKKIFIMTGELSGDKLGAWYLDRVLGYKPVVMAAQDKLVSNEPQDEGSGSASAEAVHIEAVGGDFLAGAGAQLYARFETLNITGLFEIVSKLPYIVKMLKQLTAYIIDNNFDEVVLIDFPGFNLKLAQYLKKKRPELTITYFSPPQLWCWGAWRIKKLKKYCDHLIVLYPFEVEWYKQRGLEVQWVGSPVYDRLSKYFELADANKKKYIAIFPGSRIAEIENMFAAFAQVMKRFLVRYPDVICVLPIAQSISRNFIEQKMSQTGLDGYSNRVRVIVDEQEKYNVLSQCCLAITKPGTVTLELALLGIPAIVMFKTTWLNYLLMRPFVRVRYMALPNLLLNKEVYPELIQGDCVPERIFEQATSLYESYCSGGDQYRYKQQELLRLRAELSPENKIKK
ncbi:MAG: lipid-A-disaccharide synthase [bacterium]